MAGVKRLPIATGEKGRPRRAKDKRVRSSKTSNKRAELREKRAEEVKSDDRTLSPADTAKMLKERYGLGPSVDGAEEGDEEGERRRAQQLPGGERLPEWLDPDNDAIFTEVALG